MKWNLECVGCGKKASFKDIFAVTEAKWHVVGWDVKTAEPKCACAECEYPPKVEKKKETV